MKIEDIEAVIKECIANADENGFAIDIDEMTADELANEMLDVNDCFDKDDREHIVGIVLKLQEVRAGFLPAKAVGDLKSIKRANEPQACAYKTKADLRGGWCVVCGAGSGEPCRRSAQDIERERQWNERAAKRRWERELEEDQSGFASFHGS